MDIVLAVDVGSSSVRRCPFAVTRSSAFTAPLGRVGVSRKAVSFCSLGTASAVEMAQATASVVYECLERLRKVIPSFQVTAIGFACFSMSLVGVDSSGTPVTPVFTYADRHPGTVSALDRLKEALQAGDAQGRGALLG